MYSQFMMHGQKNIKMEQVTEWASLNTKLVAERLRAEGQFILLTADMETFL